MLKENLIILRNIHGFSQEGIVIIPAEIFEASDPEFNKKADYLFHAVSQF